MQPLVFLVLANLAFLIGPFAFKLFDKNPRFGMFLDGVTYMAIISFCFFHVLPEIIEFKAYSALLVFCLGLFVPLCPDYFQKKIGAQGPSLSVGFSILVVCGVGLHVFAEGALLATQHSLSQLNFGVSVIVHRFGVGVVILNYFLNRHTNQVYAYISLFLLVLGTCLGFFLEDLVHSHSHSYVLLFIEAFIAGNLLHFIKHSPIFSKPHHNCGHHHHHQVLKKGASFHSRWTSETSFSAYGALTVAAFLIVDLLYLGQIETKKQFLDISETLLRLLDESALPLLVAYFSAGLFKAFIRPSHLNWLRKGRSLGQAFKGLAFGLPLPICSCGVLPVYQSLIKKGVPLSAALAFLIATPEIGFDAIFLSFALLGKKFSLIRILAAATLAIVVALIFSYFSQDRSGSKENDTKEAFLPLKQRVREGAHYGFIELVDHTIPWIVVGLVLAAVLEQYVSYEIFQNLSSVKQVFLFALMGLPLYICASGATPLAAILLHKGISAGAVLAFLLAGPATNLSTFGILSKLHSRKFAVFFGAGVWTAAVLLGLSINLFELSIGHLIHDELHHAADPFKRFWTVILIGVILISFLRQGIRNFINHLFSTSHSH